MGRTHVSQREWYKRLEVRIIHNGRLLLFRLFHQLDQARIYALRRQDALCLRRQLTRKRQYCRRHLMEGPLTRQPRLHHLLIHHPHQRMDHPQLWLGRRPQRRKRHRHRHRSSQNPSQSLQSNMSLPCMTLPRRCVSLADNLQ